MLASINTNLSVYIEPNEKTWNILREHYSWEDGPELEKHLKDFKRYHLLTVNIDGTPIQLLAFQIHQFMNIFGKYMKLGNTDGPYFQHNQVYFELGNMCPIFKKEQIPALGEPTRYRISPKSTVSIMTDSETGDTVKVKLSNADDAFVYWTNPETSETYELNDEIVAGEHDYIIDNGHTAIVLMNTTGKPVTCDISFAAYKTEQQ